MLTFVRVYIKMYFS